MATQFMRSPLQTILENDLLSFRRTNEAFKERAFRLERENSELQAQLALEKTRSNEVCLIYLISLLSELIIFIADCTNG